MKNKFLSKGIFAGALMLVVAMTTSSCKKNDVDESGTVNLKVVNASSASSDQGFYVAGNTVIQGGLSFGESSDYIVTRSGSNLEFQFKNESSGGVFASTRSDVDNGGYYTVFLTGDGQAARVKIYPDNNAMPSSGKVKVRFIHLSDAAPNSIDLRTTAGTNLVAGLNRDNASDYIELNPGVLSLRVYQAGQSTNIGSDFNLTAFAENRIYTVYITGSTTANIAVRQIAHN